MNSHSSPPLACDHEVSTVDKLPGSVLHHWGEQLDLDPPRNAVDLYNLEEGLSRQLIQLGGYIMGIILTQTSQDRKLQIEANDVLRTSSELEWSNRYYTEVQVQTKFGNKVTFRSSNFHPINPDRRKKNAPGCHPLLIHLGMENRCTPFLQSEVAREVVESPYEEVRQRFLLQGIDLSTSRLQKIVGHFGDRVDRWIRPCWPQRCLPFFLLPKAVLLSSRSMAAA